jgi:hypothetical protein
MKIFVSHNLANQQLSQSGKMNVSNVKRVQVRIVANGSQKNCRSIMKS